MNKYYLTLILSIVVRLFLHTVVHKARWRSFMLSSATGHLCPLPLRRMQG